MPAYLPDFLDFHLPRPHDQLCSNVPVHDDLGSRYPQLITWCLIQNYWYYCIQRPRVPDSFYDDVVAHVQEIEDEARSEIKILYNPHGVNLSPTGGTWSYRDRSHYPILIQNLFSEIAHDRKHEYELPTANNKAGLRKLLSKLKLYTGKKEST